MLRSEVFRGFLEALQQCAALLGIWRQSLQTQEDEAFTGDTHCLASWRYKIIWGAAGGENRAWKSQHEKTPVVGIASPAGAALRAREKSAGTSLGRTSPASPYQGGDPLLLSTTHPALPFSAGSVPGQNISLTCKPHFGKPARALSTPCFLQPQLDFVLTRAGY